MGFNIPITTPPNPILKTSGNVTNAAMMKHGLALDLAGFVVIVALVGGVGWLLP
jgi:di/tricarboxylate transporter